MFALRDEPNDSRDQITAAMPLQQPSSNEMKNIFHTGPLAFNARCLSA